MNGASSHSSYFAHCRSVNSFVSPTTYPEPTLRAGLYLEGSETFYNEISGRDWMKTVHSNGSITYSYDKVSFEVCHSYSFTLLCPSLLKMPKSSCRIEMNCFHRSTRTVPWTSSSWSRWGSPSPTERTYLSAVSPAAARHVKCLSISLSCYIENR